MKLRLISTSVMLLSISLSLAVPAEAQHHGSIQVGAPVIRQPQGMPNLAAQNFPHPAQAQHEFRQPPVQPSQFPRDFGRRQPLSPVPGGFSANQQLDYARQQQLDRAYRGSRPDVRLPYPDTRTRSAAPGWDRNRQYDPRGSAEQWRNERGQDRPPVYYHGHEPFNGRGVYDPYNHLRAGQGFYERNDPRFFDRQFGARWGYGWYGRTNGNWSNYRVGGRWPWYPAVGIGVGIGFYNGWGYNGINIGFGDSGYYAVDGFCPTEYLYLVTTGQYWRPVAGGPGWYGSDLPASYNAPITVAVSEVVPVEDEDGEVVSYEKHVFYYNAFWDSSEGAYGYYDYEGSFHWVE